MVTSKPSCLYGNINMGPKNNFLEVFSSRYGDLVIVLKTLICTKGSRIINNNNKARTRVPPHYGLTTAGSVPTDCRLVSGHDGTDDKKSVTSEDHALLSRCSDGGV